MSQTSPAHRLVDVVDRWGVFASLAVLALLYGLLPRVSGTLETLVWGVALVLVVLPAVDLVRKVGELRS